MTFVQRSESVHRSTSFERESLRHNQHDATERAATMSDHGPEHSASVIPPDSDLDLVIQALQIDGQDASLYSTEGIGLPVPTSALEGSRRSSRTACARPEPEGTTNPIRLEDFVELLRLQRRGENRQLLLQQRRRVLQKTIALSGRLHRLSLWVRDGLVEISKHEDAAAFVRVHQHMQDLIDLSYSQWNHDLHALDPVEATESGWTNPTSSVTFLPKLSSNAQMDLLGLLSCLRSNSRFLIERFKSLSHPQVVALSTMPRYSSVAQSVLSSYQDRGRVPQRKRVKTFSKSLEEYASSFERSNPLFFLLFNIYGAERQLSAPENQLRLSTWSTVCAELLMSYPAAYQGLLPQLLSAFASIHEWRVRDAVELFLMGVLQRGAFLLDLVSKSKGPVSSGYDPLNTQQAQEFFEEAVLDLFEILSKCDGGFPVGALRFASAVLGKLPPGEQQMRFRGDFFSAWFLDEFLRIIIYHPENENMLLKFHVSKDAREHILFPLWAKIETLIADMYSASPSQEVPGAFRYYVDQMISHLEPVDLTSPYPLDTNDQNQSAPQPDSTITICASEVVQVLEAFSPQAMHGPGQFEQFLTTSNSIFHDQYSYLNGRFDRLRREMVLILEPGSSANDVHPCQEQWLQLCITNDGEPKHIDATTPVPPVFAAQNDHNLDLVQRAALRICDDVVLDNSIHSSTSWRTDISWSHPLETIFKDLIMSTRARNDPIARLYWEDALKILQIKYPLSNLAHNDSAIFRKLVSISKQAQEEHTGYCMQLEAEVSLLEEISANIRNTITRFESRSEALKLKMWYSLDVVSSKFYEDAKNITGALNNMALTMLKQNILVAQPSTVGRRPMSSRSTTSSIFSQNMEDTMSILKAPTEHGGPKKLADTQIENTKRWLQRSNIDNFCKGEERIHRFCMEVATASRKLVGESLSDSPVLWSSELFTRERGYYDIHTFGVNSAPASTRPASVMSETLSTSLRSSRPVYRSSDSARLAIAEDRRSPVRRISLHGSLSGRSNRDMYVPELASSVGSPGRAFSATTTESLSTFWSPLPSNTRSMTSVSVCSRTASTYNDMSLSRFTDTTRGKAKFLEKTHQTLICLLLSDLGCPVWSLGSETDAWLDSSRQTEGIIRRLKQRMTAAALVDRESLQKRDTEHTNTDALRRRASLPTQTRGHDCSVSDPATPLELDEDAVVTSPSRQHVVLEDLQDLLVRLSQQVDPLEKLQIVDEFYRLSLMQLRLGETPLSTRTSADLKPPSRRSSLDSQLNKLREEGDERLLIQSQHERNEPSENRIVQQLKAHLAEMSPKTLFRDLQYIAAFVPTELTDNTPCGKAFLHLGLAALAYKDEVCRSMVDVAHKTMAKDSIKRLGSINPSESTITKATEYWMLAAREGNAVAQRELALLYLSHASSLPIVTLPLSVSSEIFKTDVVWPHGSKGGPSAQALCLALHWMHQAADNGDVLAKQKLEKLKAGHSIR